MTDLAAADLSQRLAGDAPPWVLDAREELIDGVEVGGVATFLGDAARSRVAFFV